MINIILVDDHALFRLGIKGALMGLRNEICIVGEANCGKAFFSLLETTQADMVLLDIMLPDMTGIEIARRLRKEHPEIKILALSAENTSDVVKALLDIGIEGFISKRQGAGNDLREAIFAIASGLEYFGKDIAPLIYDIFVSKKKSIEFAVVFTDREKEIISLCREGLLSKEIAERLYISSRTVDSHKTNIFKKLGINNTVEMVQYALKHGIINLE
jgi:DNA-binding NarL/FixJ family response regulator